MTNELPLDSQAKKIIFGPHGDFCVKHVQENECSSSQIWEVENPGIRPTYWIRSRDRLVASLCFVPMLPASWAFEEEGNPGLFPCS